VHQPQQVATWLLDRFAPEALVGDLLEEYATGHSRRWYWWQVVVALAITMVLEARTLKVLALRAPMVGWACVTSCAVIALAWWERRRRRPSDPASTPVA
jgi:hypothetical protein